MKKIFYVLLAVSITFASCKKEEDEVVTPTVVNGCTDISAINYNASATNDDGSCTYSIVGVWTPTSISGTSSMSVVVLGETIDSFDTTFTMTAAEAGMDGDVEFTSDGKMYADGDTNTYSYSGNMLTITDDEGTETNSCIVTSTNLTLMFSDTDTYTEDYMGLEATITETADMTLNATRQ